jgi:ubiquinol-cytochrome c reductase iron-sulfur subunit
MLKLTRISRRSFGWGQDYKSRLEAKMTGTHQIMPTHQFFTTPTRPSNFGEQLDLKAQLDNWFDENRIHNEENPETRRTQMYLLNAVGWAGIASLIRLFTVGFVGRWIGWKRYDRDTYLEVDISAVPPGEVIQIVWNGEPVFIRRLTRQEVIEEEAAPEHGLLDRNSHVLLNEDLNSKVLVCSAKCTHLGCIPIPYLGNFKGWTCICHGSVFDRFGRVRQGPALENLRNLNNSLYGDILCIEELKYPREPSTRHWA